MGVQMNMRADKDLIKFQINRTLAQKEHQRVIAETLERVQDIGPGALQTQENKFQIYPNDSSDLA